MKIICIWNLIGLTCKTVGPEPERVLGDIYHFIFLVISPSEFSVHGLILAFYNFLDVYPFLGFKFYSRVIVHSISIIFVNLFFGSCYFIFLSAPVFLNLSKTCLFSGSCRVLFVLLIFRENPAFALFNLFVSIFCLRGWLLTFISLLSLWGHALFLTSFFEGSAF